MNSPLLNIGCRLLAIGYSGRGARPLLCPPFRPRAASVSHNTQHATRNTPPRLSSPAFTLIELLVVISIIGILAALGLSVTAGIKHAQTRARAKAELAQAQAAIENYKTKRGYYPPDNPGGAWEQNTLYYELVGTTDTGAGFQPLSGGGSTFITYATAKTLSAGGVLNCTRGDGDDLLAMSFTRSLRPNQYLTANTPIKDATVLGTAIQGPVMFFGTGGLNGTINPWRYQVTPRASRALKNASSFDLWIDIIVGSETNRISNWSQNPEKL